MINYHFSKTLFLATIIIRLKVCVKLLKLSKTFAFSHTLLPETLNLLEKKIIVIPTDLIVPEELTRTQNKKSKLQKINCQVYLPYSELQRNNHILIY